MLEQLTTVSLAKRFFRVLCLITVAIFLAWVTYACLYVNQGVQLVDIQAALSHATDKFIPRVNQLQKDSEPDLKETLLTITVPSVKDAQKTELDEQRKKGFSENMSNMSRTTPNTREWISYLSVPKTSVLEIASNLTETTNAPTSAPKKRIASPFRDIVIKPPHVLRLIDSCSNNSSEIRKKVQGLLSSDDTMQQFSNHFVYRAYYDTRLKDKPVIRIISILPYNQTYIHCHVHFSQDYMVTVRGVYSFFRVNHKSKELHSAMLLCPLPQLPDSDPDFVILSEERCGPAVAALDVIVPHRQKMQYNFTVCLHQPLFNVNVSILPRILEWIAVNRVFGAERFVVYYLDSTKTIVDELQPLVESGLMESHFWSYHIRRDRVEGLIGQLSLLNDCMYRHMYTSLRILLLDFDEIATPHKHSDWRTMLASTPCANRSSANFVNAFFPLTMNNDKNADYNLNVLMKMTRDGFSTCTRRSKVVLDPRRIISSHIHSVNQFLESNERGCCIPTDLAYLHHYRTSVIAYNRVSDKNITDNRMKDFREDIILSTKYIYQIMDRDFNKLRL